jgi:hypothetical protein
MTNALASVVTGGFEKRPATAMIAKLSFLDATKTYKVHPIDRSSTEQDFICFQVGSDPQVFAFNASTGAQKTVTIGDTIHSFIIEADTLDSTISSGVVQVDGADFEEQVAFASGETSFAWTWDTSDAVTLRFKVQGSADGAVWNDIQTGIGGAGSGSFSTTIDAVATGDHNYIRVVVTTSAADAVNDTLSVRAAFQDLTYLLGTARDDIKVTSVADFTFITNRNKTTRMEAQAINTESGSIASTVQEFSDLPAATGSGNIRRVRGSDADGFGTFYVKDNGSGDYIEIVDPTGNNVFDESRMPHQLVRSADGTTYTYSAATWEERPSGDAVLNPEPGFIGGVVNDIAFYRNRLVFISDETTYLSQSGDVFNMWAAKATAVLDSDPIERGATATNVNILQYAAVFRKLLFLTSAQAQFELESGDRALTPETAQMNLATTFKAQTKAKPVSMGDVLYFAAQTEGSAVVYEYFFQDSNFSNTATDISRHVKGYIGNDIIEMYADPSTSTLFVLTTDEQNSLFIYRTFFDDDQKLQSAWGKYTFGSTEAKAFIHGFAIFSNWVYIVVERQDGAMYVEWFPIERESLVTDMPFMPLADQREELTGTYDSTHNETFWQTTWEHEDDAKVVIGAGGTNPGQELAVRYPDKILLTLSSVAAGETLIIGGKTFTAHATTTTTTLREFSIAGIDSADAAELETVLNDTTDGIGASHTATDNGDGTVTVVPNDMFDGSLATPTGTAITNLTITSTDVPDLVVARGDHSAAAAYVGRTYTMTVELSKIYPREENSPIVTGRLQLKDITTLYENTGYFKLQVTPDGGRAVKSYVFGGAVLGSSDLQVDEATLSDSGVVAHPKIMARARTTKIEYINDTVEPCVITSVQWRGTFNEVGRQG